ncbi:hypothetical protein [Embleya scabrispora]|uniref:hypothetical protein n=1 Tax=Embleya scabrispora TaxID=159449 RepID=UPI00117DAEB5|nr:hypothetical protein [Embleya scabrispora]
MEKSRKDAIDATLVLENKEPMAICDRLEDAEAWRRAYLRLLSNTEHFRTHAIAIQRKKGGFYVRVLKLTSDSPVPLRICYSLTEARKLQDEYAKSLTKEGRGASHAIIIHKLRGGRDLWGVFEFER